MKSWEEVNEAVNDLLLVDGLRKGRGVERFRDRMILAGARDLQSYVPYYRSIPEEKSYTNSDMENIEDTYEQATFDFLGARVLDVIVRVMEDNAPDDYYRPSIISASLRHSIFDGGHKPRSVGYTGRVCFDRGKIYSAPILKDNEVLKVLYSLEENYKPLFKSSAEEKSAITRFDDDAVLAIHYYVKYHFMKDVNDDENSAQQNLSYYTKERRKLFHNKKELAPVSDPQLTSQGGSFVIGHG